MPVFATVLDAWSGKLRATVLSHTVESVSFESKDTAVVQGKYRLEGLQFWDLERLFISDTKEQPLDDSKGGTPSRLTTD